MGEQPQCVSPLLLIPGEGKHGYWLCQNLRMLSSVTEWAWGPPMEMFMRLHGISNGVVFSSFDLTKGFLRIPIPKGDRTYFSFMFWADFILRSVILLNLSIAWSSSTTLYP